MTTLFDRRYILIVDTLRVETLDIKFDVKLEDKNLGKAEINVWNLNTEHRKKIEDAKVLDVELYVGYEGQGDLGLIFRGQMRDGYSTKDAQDWLTTLRTGDGDKAVQSRINRSYKPGASLETLFNDAVNALKDQVGVGVGNAIKAFKEGKFKDGITELAKGGNLQGNTLKEVKRLARGAGLDVMIQDGELVVTKINQPLAATAVVLNRGTGLIGSPQKGNKGLLKARALLVPGLRPKRKVKIESELTNGIYVVKRVQYKGDTSANDWYADIECKEI